jgi:hypothetical protein
VRRGINLAFGTEAGGARNGVFQTRGFPCQCVFSSTPQRYPEKALVRGM